MSKNQFPVFIILFFFIFQSCGTNGTNSLPVADTACQPKTAQIQLMDGFTQRACGCDEGPATLPADQPLICTVRVGSTVLFHFVGSRTSHQIIPTGSSTLEASSVYHPLDPPVPHAVVLSTAGAYGFKDAFSPSSSGTLIAN